MLGHSSGGMALNNHLLALLAVSVISPAILGPYIAEVCSESIALSIPASFIQK